MTHRALSLYFRSLAKTNDVSTSVEPQNSGLDGFVTKDYITALPKNYLLSSVTADGKDGCGLKLEKLANF